MAKTEESQGKSPRERRRAYAWLVYPDSAPEDWMQRLADTHIMALVSPLHDRDTNPDGTQKKPHWHCLCYFEGKKSLDQINELRREILGTNYNPGLEDVASVRGYARYLIHRDNPEKAQYSAADVRAFGGMDFDAMCALPSDDNRMLEELFKYIRENRIMYFSDLCDAVAISNPDWFSMIVSRKTYVVKEYIKSYAVSIRLTGGGRIS